jgi:hypothetical protein
LTIPKVYLETTMFSFYYEERQEACYQKLRDQTRQVFERITVLNFWTYSPALDD